MKDLKARDIMTRPVASARKNASARDYRGIGEDTRLSSWMSEGLDIMNHNNKEVVI
jgi:hypothetical protein